MMPPRAGRDQLLGRSTSLMCGSRQFSPGVANDGLTDTVNGRKEGNRLWPTYTSQGGILPWTAATPKSKVTSRRVVWKSNPPIPGPTGIVKIARRGVANDNPEGIRRA